MGAKSQKRARSLDQGNGNDDSPLKRRRQLNDKAQNLSSVYENLAAESDDVRLEAATEFLMRFLPENKPTAKDVEAALGRLIQGLCSQRKAARVGFSLTLTELLRQIYASRENTIEGLDLDVSSLIKTVEQKTKFHGNVSGRERRDHLIGKLFGYQAIIQSSIVFEPVFSLECWNLLLDLICGMAHDIPWLREECGMVLVESVQNLKVSIKSQNCIKDVVKHLNARKLLYTPAGVGVWLTIQRNHEDVLPEGIWHENDPLSKKERLRLAKILKENFHDGAEKDASTATKTAGANPNPSFAWDLALFEVLRRDEQSRSKGKSKLKFPQFWIDIVDENLFSANSSHERKAWGFRLLSNMMKRAPEWAVSALLSPNLTRTLTNQSKDQTRFLHTAALAALRAVQARAEQDPDLALPIFEALSTKDNSIGSDRHVITNTLEQILLSADDANIRKILRHLNSLLLRPGSEDSAVADRRRQAVADLLLNTVKHYRRYSELNENALDKDSWLPKALEILVENAYFIPSKDAKTRKVPLPPVSDRNRSMFQERLSSCLTRLFDADIDHRSAIAVSTISMIRTKSTSTESLELVMKADKAVLDTIDGAFRSLDALSSQKKTPKKKAAVEGLILLYSLTLLQVYNGEGDAIMILTDLDAAHQGMFNKVKDSKADGPDHFVEIILSFLGNPRTLFHKIGEEAFSIFSSEIRSGGLQSLITILDTEESLEGQQELFDPASDMSEGDESSDDTDSASDVEMIEGEAQEPEDDASEGSTSDDDIESGSGGDSDTESSEDDAELTQFNNLLALTLQTSKPKLNGDNAEDSSDESDMDDDQMMALDPHLSKIFQQRSKTTSTKQQRKNARQNVIQLKSRVLDLVAIYIAKQYSSPLILDMLLPVLRRTRGQSNEQITEKAGKVLKTLFNARTKHKASLPKPDNVSGVWELLEGIHEEAKMGGGAKLHANSCSAASLYVVKILVGLEKSNYSRVVDIYGATQKEWFMDKTSSLQPVLFTQFQNWSQERRKTGKQED